MCSSEDQKTEDVPYNEDSTEQEENDAEEQNEDENNGASSDDYSPGKIFVGGLSKNTTRDVFTEHFSKYGEITDSIILIDRLTGQPRGFGFVTYADPSVVDKVIEDTHVLDGKTVEIKRSIPIGNMIKGPNTNKIFVGGIPSSITEDKFKEYFSKYGKVAQHLIMKDRNTGLSRGFGFITFESEEGVEEIISKGKMMLGGKQQSLSAFA